MPKMKTNRSAAKRFNRTGSGKIKRNRANANHLLQKKSAARKRRLRKGALLAKGDAKLIQSLIAYK